MIITKKEYMKREDVGKGVERAAQTVKITIWWFLFIPVFTVRTILTTNL